MTKEKQVYKCEKCGNMVEVLIAGDGELVCCGQPMKLMVEGSTDAAKEKHVPVITKEGDGYRVTVGSVAHPMEEKHSIKWIELITGQRVYRRDLTPENKPEAVFVVKDKGGITARAYCDLHGLWKAEIK